MLRRILLAPLLLGLSLVACGQGGDACKSGACAGSGGIPGAGGSGGTGGEDCSGVIMKVGTGDTTFRFVEDGTALDLIKGSQGGYHVWTAFLAKGFDPHGQMYAQIDTYLDDGTLYGHYAYCLTELFGDLPEANGWREKAGLQARVGTENDKADPPVDLMGKTVTVKLFLRDGVAIDPTKPGGCDPTQTTPHCEATAQMKVRPQP